MKKRKKLNHIRIVISVVLLLVILMCAKILILQTVQKQQAAEAYQQLQETNKQVIEQEEPEPEFPYEGVPEVDFEHLQKEVNSDICAWITIPGTVIDYPVLRNASAEEPHDAYYLEYNIDGSYGRPGTIYMEPCNSEDFTDYQTVLYGHNMNNGTMFADLHKFDDEDFFEHHEYVYIVIPEKVLVYRIFATVNYDDKHLMRTYDFSQETQRQEFLDSLHNNRDEGDKFKENVGVTTESRLLTLSTCIKGKKKNRLLVGTVLVDEYEREYKEIKTVYKNKDGNRSLRL